MYDLLNNLIAFFKAKLEVFKVFDEREEMMIFDDESESHFVIDK